MKAPEESVEELQKKVYELSARYCHLEGYEPLDAPPPPPPEEPKEKSKEKTKSEGEEAKDKTTEESEKAEEKTEEKSEKGDYGFISNYMVYGCNFAKHTSSDLNIHI